jgi:acetyltransferase-like isoleucine patch superfamily enzyme
MILGGFGARSSIRPMVFIEHPFNVFIGTDTTVNEFAMLQANPEAQIKIGDRVHISYRATILTASLDFNDGFYGGGHKDKSVEIADDVWIAAGAIILPGIKIGARSVVAAGAVVTHDVEPGTIVAGVPAKPIRKLNPQNNN